MFMGLKFNAVSVIGKLGSRYGITNETVQGNHCNIVRKYIVSSSSINRRGQRNTVLQLHSIESGRLLRRQCHSTGICCTVTMQCIAQCIHKENGTSK